MLIHVLPSSVLLPFFFNDTATTEIYTLSLHDALPICHARRAGGPRPSPGRLPRVDPAGQEPLREPRLERRRSEEHTSELQSLRHLVCRLLLEKKKKMTETGYTPSRRSP